MNLFVFGSSLVSCYWNGAATYYRGIYKGLHVLGHAIVFAEPDIYDRQRHRDGEETATYAAVQVYRTPSERDALLAAAATADLIVKHSGIGSDDDYLAAAVLQIAAERPLASRPRTAYWDVDAPATLDEVEADPGHYLRALLPRFDFVFTYGGGAAVTRRFLALGARNCHPIYNGFDPAVHYPVSPRPEWRSDLSFVGHRLPDRETRVQALFFDVAARCPSRSFLLAGAGWESAALPPNVRYVGHAPSRLHNAINCSARFVLNVNRESMARCGFSPPTRIFEAAGAAAATITDLWPGLDSFFVPGRDILVAADGAEVAHWLGHVSPNQASALGAAMRVRALAAHTYAQRAARVDAILSTRGGRGRQVDAKP